MAVIDPQEEVMKRMQGLKDSRGPVGMMARGKNMYPGGNAAQTGPGGPDMGRPPTAVPPQAVQAVMQRTGNQMPNPSVGAPPPGQVMQKPPPADKMIAKLSKAALQAAAQRKLKR